VVLARPFFFITTGYFFIVEIVLSISRIFLLSAIVRKFKPVKVQGRLSPPEGCKAIAAILCVINSAQLLIGSNIAFVDMSKPLHRKLSRFVAEIKHKKVGIGRALLGDVVL
jgi:hypothetical protein